MQTPPFTQQSTRNTGGNETNFMTKPNPTTMTTPQPIATAPKGRRILVYCPRKIESEGWWQVGTFDEDTCRWIDDDYEPGCMLVQPTYWMPWPQPPQPQ